ncbi:MAG: exopolyphosphatase, partial [Eubacteriaceae bacterium]|nr:exopolyphosphatase [Eubacteriaceae bacterium]
SFYLILNSGLYGLTHKELLMSAFSALNHRTNKKVKVDAAYEAMLSGKDKAVIDTVSLFLQIGEYLDRSMDGVVEDIRCEMTKDTVTMHVISREHTVFADMVMQECGKKFNRVLGRELRVLNDVVAVE